MKVLKTTDEPFSIKDIEVNMSENIISISNHKNNRSYTELIEEISNEYENNELIINKLIEEIKELISFCDPLRLMKYGYDRFIESNGGIAAEVNLSREAIFIGKELEYIQSVLVSSENRYGKSENSINEKEIFARISSKINELYSLTQLSLMYRTSKSLKDNNFQLDLEIEEFLMEAQLSMFVRGDRYAIYEIPHLRSLLEAHSEELIKLYGISIDEFIDGMDNIQKSLLSIKNSKIFGENSRSFFKIIELLNKYEEFEQNELNIDAGISTEYIMERFMRSLDVESLKCVDENAYDDFDLEKITKFPRSLLEDLSYKLNENKYFYNNDYAGYPIIELPIFSKPFINIDNKFYCFDYYNLFDNIYRVIQKVIRAKDATYKDKWMSVQMETTEKIVADLFKKLLPNCIIYTSNYYPKNKSLKQCNENDLLVIYDDNLIIIEVKAGAYSYRAPILDIDSHIKSLKTLVEKADNQAQRILEYFQTNKSAKIYDSNKNEKCEIKIEEFNEITLMSVTLDNFNEFCAKIEKLEFLNINKNSIALSIDDLRVYSDYFDTPIEFLHYLRQRKIATENSNLYLNDELDHLGMYIEEIFYSQKFKDEDYKKIYAYGYREELDDYFGSLINKGLGIEKPKQSLPVELYKIIKFLGEAKIKDIVKVGTYLLDFSPESKEDINDKISLALIRQREINRMVQIALMGEAPLNIFCHQENINNMSLDETERYTLAHMLEFNEEVRLELNVYYDIKNRIKDIKFKFHKRDDIPKEKIEEIKKYSEELFKYRVENYKKQLGVKKIGRNEKCPCGSNKKYKNCHGK